MADLTPPMIMSSEKTIYELRQVTVTSDAEITNVNQLLTEGWRLMSIGHQSAATVYVLGRTEEKPRHRPGFLAGD